MILATVDEVSDGFAGIGLEPLGPGVCLLIVGLFFAKLPGKPESYCQRSLPTEVWPAGRVGFYVVCGWLFTLDRGRDVGGGGNLTTFSVWNNGRELFSWR